MICAKDIMAPAVISVTAETSIDDAMDILFEKQISGLPVVDENGRLIGIVSEADRLKILTNPQHSESALVADIMTRGVVIVDENTSFSQAADLLMRVGIRRLPVMRDGCVVGIISRRDLLKAIHQRTV